LGGINSSTLDNNRCIWIRLKYLILEDNLLPNGDRFPRPQNDWCSQTLTADEGAIGGAKVLEDITAFL
jgi:hypothetical protein